MKNEILAIDVCKYYWHSYHHSRNQQCYYKWKIYIGDEVYIEYSLDDQDDMHPVKELYGMVLSVDESKKTIDQINSVEFASWNSSIEMGEMFKYFDNTNPSVYRMTFIDKNYNVKTYRTCDGAQKETGWHDFLVLLHWMEQRLACCDEQALVKRVKELYVGRYITKIDFPYLFKVDNLERQKHFKAIQKEVDYAITQELLRESKEENCQNIRFEKKWQAIQGDLFPHQCEIFNVIHYHMRKKEILKKEYGIEFLSFLDLNLDKFICIQNRIRGDCWG